MTSATTHSGLEGEARPSREPGERFLPRRLTRGSPSNSTAMIGSATHSGLEGEARPSREPGERFLPRRLTRGSPSNSTAMTSSATHSGLEGEARPSREPGESALPRRLTRGSPSNSTTMIGSATHSGLEGERQRGAVLIVALWVVIILSLMVSTLAFEMHVEAKVTSYYRKRMKAQYLTLAGVEWAKMMLTKSRINDPFLEENFPDLFVAAEMLRRGNAVSGITREVGEGTFTVDLVPEQGRRNVNRLDLDNWYALLEQGNVSEDLWDELIDAFMDWIDQDDQHRLNGAESDDSYYEERGYEVKNGLVDTIDELVLIKGFTPEIVYGGPAEDPEEPPYPGLAEWLTTVGDGKVNINAAPADVLLSLPGVDEFAVEAILEGRLGVDGEYRTEDDGFDSVGEMLQLTGLDPNLAGQFTIRDQAFVRMKVVGEVGDVRSGIWAIYRLEGNLLVPHFWREEQLP